MAIAQEHLVVVLFVVAIVGIACCLLVGPFLLFRNQQQGTKKAVKRFLLSNWKWLS